MRFYLGGYIYLPLTLEAAVDEIMCVKSRVDWTYLKVILKFINNKPKQKTCTILRQKSLQRYAFKPYIWDYIYMDGKKLCNLKLVIFLHKLHLCSWRVCFSIFKVILVHVIFNIFSCKNIHSQTLISNYF
jgi:hypothetical protein